MLGGTACQPSFVTTRKRKSATGVPGVELVDAVPAASVCRGRRIGEQSEFEKPRCANCGEAQIRGSESVLNASIKRLKKNLVSEYKACQAGNTIIMKCAKCNYEVQKS